MKNDIEVLGQNIYTKNENIVTHIFNEVDGKAQKVLEDEQLEVHYNHLKNLDRTNSKKGRHT